MNLTKIIAPIVRKARRDPAVLAVMLYGSQARGDATPASDIDVCLVLRPAVRSLLALSKKRLAYAGLADVDLQVFQNVPLPLRSRILKEGRVLFCKDEEELYEVAYRTVQAFEDFRRHYNEYLEAVAHG